LPHVCELALVRELPSYCPLVHPLRALDDPSFLLSFLPQLCSSMHLPSRESIETHLDHLDGLNVHVTDYQFDVTHAFLSLKQLNRPILSHHHLVECPFHDLPC